MMYKSYLPVTLFRHCLSEIIRHWQSSDRRPLRVISLWKTAFQFPLRVKIRYKHNGNFVGWASVEASYVTRKHNKKNLFFITDIHNIKNGSKQYHKEQILIVMHWAVFGSGWLLNISKAFLCKENLLKINFDNILMKCKSK